MKYLVTGGLGFVGNELVRQLLAADNEVVVLDNCTGMAPDIGDIIDKIKLYKSDITVFDEVQNCISKEMPDSVIHLAAMHFIPQCNQFPLKTQSVNVTGTIHVLESCSINNISNCTVLSSGSIYADSDLGLEEDTSEIKIFDAYSHSKLAVENLCKLYAIRNPITRYHVIRLFNVYGPRETNPHIIPEIINQLKQGDILDLGNIEPRRDFIYVKDAAAGIIAISNRTKGNTIETINLCSGVDYAMKDIIELIGTITNRNIIINTNPLKYRAQDKLFQKGATKKLATTAGFKCMYDIEIGLKELLDYESLLK